MEHFSSLFNFRVAQNKAERIALSRKSCSYQSKVPQMSAKTNDTFALLQDRFKVFFPS